MAARALPNLGLMGFWDLGAPYKDQMDANLRVLSVVSQGRVLNRLSTLPGSPANGNVYIMTGGTNLHAIAVRDNGAWLYITPQRGWRMYDVAADRTLEFTGTAWRTVLATSAQSLAATQADVAATPAGVREFMEQYGFTASYLNGAANLNALSGATDRTVVFGFDDSTLNTPVAGSYGRGIQFASGGNYSTQIVWINGTGDSYIRFHEGTAWTSWLPNGATRSFITGGECIKLPDGTQISSGTITSPSIAISTAYMGGYRSVPQSIVFPEPFFEAPRLILNPNFEHALTTSYSAISASGADIFYTAISQQAAASRTSRYIAVGRWK